MTSGRSEATSIRTGKAVRPDILFLKRPRWQRTGRTHVQQELEQLGVAVEVGDGAKGIRSKRTVRNPNYVEHSSRNHPQTNVRVVIVHSQPRKFSVKLAPR